jgi:hypothetical protein
MLMTIRGEIVSVYYLRDSILDRFKITICGKILPIYYSIKKNPSKYGIIPPYTVCQKNYNIENC